MYIGMFSIVGVRAVTADVDSGTSIVMPGWVVQSHVCWCTWVLVVVGELVVCVATRIIMRQKTIPW